MPFRNLYRETEEHYGEKMQVLLPRLLNEHKKVARVARVLGVSRNTLNRWLDIAGVQNCYVVGNSCADAYNDVITEGAA